MICSFVICNLLCIKVFHLTIKKFRKLETKQLIIIGNLKKKLEKLSKCSLVILPGNSFTGYALY